MQKKNNEGRNIEIFNIHTVLKAMFTVSVEYVYSRYMKLCFSYVISNVCLHRNDNVA
jgi:hypothetical protein